jgi:hypothetical protein
MGSSPIDPVVDDAMAFAAKIAKAVAARNEDLVEFFATFVGMVAQEDGAIAMRCLEAADGWFRAGEGAP